MRNVRALEKLIALGLAAAVGGAALPVVAAPLPAALSGRIVRSTTGAPAEGAVLKLALRSGGVMLESAKADAKGRYAISDIPSGSYDVAVEVDGGLYLVGAEVALSPGEKRSMSLSVLPSDDEPAPPTPPAEPPKAEEGDKEAEPEKEPPKEEKKEEKKKGVGGFLRTPWGGLTLVLGTAAIIGIAVSSTDDDVPASASPSSN